jgi:methionine-rich copper-binding protein CopC
MTRRISLHHLGTGIMILLFVLLRATPVHAQPQLVDASPAPDSVLLASPEIVVLTFDRVLIDRGTTIEVTNADGERVDNGDGSINSSNRFELSVTLPSLIEGEYTVTYTASALGESSFTQGSYRFIISPPPPLLSVVSPVNGQAFAPGPVTLEMRTEFFNFAQHDNRIRVYVDGKLEAELRSLDYTLMDLEPGVHEIRMVLARLENEELPQTQTLIYIAIKQPDPELDGREAAAQAEPAPGLEVFTPWQLGGFMLLVILLLGLGIWLGRSSVHNRELP